MSKPVHFMNTRKFVSNPGPPEKKAVSNEKKTKARKGKQKPLHTLEMLLGEKLIKANGETISPKALAGQGGIIGLYFAAHWCPPCRAFSPLLASLHNELKTAGKNFEVVFISFDSNEESFKDYFSKMPWFAIEYNEQEKRDEVAMTFGIKGIPVLLLLDAETYTVITLNGREIVMMDPKGEYFPWKEPFLEESLAATTQKGGGTQATTVSESENPLNRGPAGKKPSEIQATKQLCHGGSRLADSGEAKSKTENLHGSKVLDDNSAKTKADEEGTTSGNAGGASRSNVNENRE